MKLTYFVQRILWVDCIGAIATGLALLMFSSWVSDLYGLSRSLVVGHAFVHLFYGTYSFSLAVRSRRTMWMLLVLIVGNAAWACFCFGFAVVIARDASIFGIGHFVLEGIYVGGLALIEWNRRYLLETSV